MKKNIWFTSDHHFNHKNIIEYCDRPFSSVENMNQIMIDRWNDVVGKEDTVYVLGDFSLDTIAYVFPLTFQLNGYIKLVPGGHDWRWLEGYRKYKIGMKKLEILEPLVTLDVGWFVENDGAAKNLPLVLCHYPMLSWDRSHYGSRHLHGHTHGTIGSLGKSGDIQLPPDQKNGIRMDVGVDTNDFYPYSLDDIRKKLSD